jgi:hypothetical protein
MRGLLLDIAFIVAEMVNAIRNHHSYYKYLGKFWFIRASYWPSALGIGVDFDFQSRDEFDLSVDIGPFSFGIGRDWAVEL